MTRITALTVFLLSALAVASPVDSATPEKRAPAPNPLAAADAKPEAFFSLPTIIQWYTTTSTAMATVWGTTTMMQTVTGYHTLSAPPQSTGCTATTTVTVPLLGFPTFTVTLDPITITAPIYTITKGGCTTAPNPTYSVAPPKSYGWKRAAQADEVLYARSFE